MGNNPTDPIQQKFDNVIEKLGIQNKPKRLIVDGKFVKEFEANGNKYAYLPPDLCFNIVRQTMYHNINTAFSLNQSPVSVRKRFIDQYQNIQKLMGAKGNDWNKLMDKFLRDSINNIDSFYGELTSRYGQAYYICTLFLIREGEDLTKWDWELANEKIDDWVSANYAAQDFFSLALSSSIECQEIIKQNSEDTLIRKGII